MFHNFANSPYHNSLGEREYHDGRSKHVSSDYLSQLNYNQKSDSCASFHPLCASNIISDVSEDCDTYDDISELTNLKPEVAIDFDAD